MLVMSETRVPPFSINPKQNFALPTNYSHKAVSQKLCGITREGPVRVGLLGCGSARVLRDRLATRRYGKRPEKDFVSATGSCPSATLA